MKQDLPFRPSPAFLLRCAALVALAALAVVLWRSGLLEHLKPQRLAQTQAWAQAKFAAAPVLILAAYVLAFGVLTGVGLPVALGMSLLAGAIFGPWLGGTTIVVAATVAALVGYGIANTVLLGLAPAKARKTKGIEAFLRIVAKDPFMVVLSARLMPLLPFNAVNLAAGLASTPLRAYVPATLLGVIPTSFIYATLGSGIGGSLADRGSLMTAAKSPYVFGPVLALATLSLAATVVRLRREART